MAHREYNFDGLVGPTHTYGGLSPGNIASERHAGDIANPRAAALEGIAKMRFVASLGVGQAVLPPHPRPDVHALRRLGFSGDDATVLARAAATSDGLYLKMASSASAMWAANAATVSPSSDARDGRVHLVPANLTAMFHRSLEAPVTTGVLRSIFADSSRFVVHDPLPPGEHFSDEGAANHTRLATREGALHLFGFGRSGFLPAPPGRFPRRQTQEASEAVARLSALGQECMLFCKQHSDGIDAGAFHSDVLAVGNDCYLMLHELAFERLDELLTELEKRLGAELCISVARQAELPVRDAVDAYPFNSQLVTLPDGTMAIIAPRESEENAAARRFLDRIVAEPNPVATVHYVEVNASMNNGGGPACLRLRVPLTAEERGAIGARVFADEALLDELTRWVERHYRDRLTTADLADPALLAEVHRALDELSRLLGLGSVYDFQR